MSGQHTAAAVSGSSSSLRAGSVSITVSSRVAGLPSAPLPIKPPTAKAKAGPTSRNELEACMQTQAVNLANAVHTVGALSPENKDVGVLSELSEPETEVVTDIQGFCSPRTGVEGQVTSFVGGYINHLQQALPGSSGCSRERCNILLARELSAKGYQVTIRQHSSQGPVTSSGAGTLSGVRDTYLVFKGVPGNPHEEYVVELDFRDRFNIANPTAFYNTCLAAVPQLWVGPLDQLLPLVELLCSEMGMAFEERDLDMPPWRHHDKVASRWLSPELQSFSVDSANALAAESPSASSLGHLTGDDTDGSPDDVMGLTLTPLQMKRTCSLSFDKIEPVTSSSQGSSGFGLQKATSLLALN